MSRSHPPPLLDAGSGPLTARMRAARALAARHRRLAAAVCAGGAVLAAVSALTPPTAPPDAGGTAALAPAASLPAGTGDRPAAVAERVAVTVRLADPAGLLLLRPGAHVEVVGGAPAGSAAATGGAGDAAVLAADAVVVDVPQPAPAATGGGLLGDGEQGPAQGLDGVVVLSVLPADARRLAGAAGTRPLSVAVALPPP